MRARWAHGVALVGLASVAGCSYTPPPDGYLAVTEPSYDFGKVLVGDSTTSSAHPDWKNAGRARVRMDGVHTSGDTNTITLQPAAFPFNLNPGNFTASMFFTFEPTEARRYTIRAVAYGVGPNNRPVAADSTELAGTGVLQIDEGDLSLGGGYVQPGNGLEFGKVVVSTSAYRTVIVLNSGTGALTPTVEWRPAGGPFTASLSSGGAGVRMVSVPAGGSAALVVTFTPPAARKFVNALIVRSGGRGEAGISVSGTGVAPME